MTYVPRAKKPYNRLLTEAQRGGYTHGFALLPIGSLRDQAEYPYHPLEEKERNILIGFAQAGDEASLMTLIRCHRPIINSLAVNFGEGENMTEDLCQEAVIAFMRAVKFYKHEGNSGFLNYSIICIRNHLAQVKPQHRSTQRHPHHIYTLYFHVHREYHRLSRELMRPPTADDVSNHLNVSPEIIWIIMGFRYSHDLTSDGTLASTTSTELLDRLANYLKSLTRRQRICLLQHFGAYQQPKKVDKVIAGSLRVSRQRVVQIRQGAIEKIRALAREDGAVLAETAVDRAILRMIDRNGGSATRGELNEALGHYKHVPEALLSMKQRGVIVQEDAKWTRC